MAELKRTDYKDVRMTILGSREHLCINSNVPVPEKSYKDSCDYLLNESLCMFYTGSKKQEQDIRKRGINRSSCWDIEDLVKTGKKEKFCPYYTSRDLLATADIVFCPYNYLLDPIIRKRFSIDLEGAVVILDEAHNIEVGYSARSL